MPSATFYNLPEAKRGRLMDAVWREFTTVSYMDASINRIIQDAEISRGSFYQYFSGKQDLFGYLLETVLETVKTMFRVQLTIHGNDLFAAVLGIYDLSLWRKSRGEVLPEQERVWKLFRLNIDLDICQFAQGLEGPPLKQSLCELTTLQDHEAVTPLECQALIHLLVVAALTNLTDSVRHPEHEDRNRQILEQQLKLLRRSLERKEGAELC